MKQILKSDRHWNLYVDQIELLIDKYEKVDVKTMGFPENWKELLGQNKGAKAFETESNRILIETGGTRAYSLGAFWLVKICLG